jgi:hypothetical protein
MSRPLARLDRGRCLAQVVNPHRTPDLRCGQQSGPGPKVVARVDRSADLGREHPAAARLLDPQLTGAQVLGGLRTTVGPKQFDHLLGHHHDPSRRLRLQRPGDRPPPPTRRGQ